MLTEAEYKILKLAANDIHPTFHQRLSSGERIDPFTFIGIVISLTNAWAHNNIFPLASELKQRDYLEYHQFDTWTGAGYSLTPEGYQAMWQYEAQNELKQQSIYEAMYG